MVILVIAAILSVAGASLTAAAVADDAQAMGIQQPNSPFGVSW
jgi:hypothetical protein